MHIRILLKLFSGHFTKSKLICQDIGKSLVSLCKLYARGRGKAGRALGVLNTEIKMSVSPSARESVPLLLGLQPCEFMFTWQKRL